MARSTYLSKNLTQAQREVMLLLAENELDIFTLADIKALVGDSTETVNEILENLANKKMLARVERGTYCQPNFRDEKVIGCYLARDGVVAYWSALNIHGLTEQFPNAVFIQTTQSKSTKNVFGVSYKFVKIKSAKKTGIDTFGFGNHSYRITNKEKTIIDCFDLPAYAGGYAELIRAFSQASLDQDKMIQYCQANGNISVVKRLAFLSELLAKPKMSRFIQFAAGIVNARYVRFDPFGQETGAFNNKWKLRLNITEKELVDICNQQY